MSTTLTRSFRKSTSAGTTSEQDLFGSNWPLGYAAGDTNLYRYVGNNPMNRVDPLGLQFDSVEAAAWAAAEAYAAAQGWGASAAILHHFNELSNSDKYDVGQWGSTLDLSDNVASQKIGKKETPTILDAIKRWAAGSVNCVPMKAIPRTKVTGKYAVVYQKADDPDLYWGIHGATVFWSAEIEVDLPKKSPDGCCTVTYRIQSIDAKLEDDFDFNPGQFKDFPAKQLNDIGASNGVPFHIIINLNGFGWDTNNKVTVPCPSNK